MPSEGSDQVADELVVTTETLAGGTEASVTAEDVEQPAPLTVGLVAEVSASWADLSEVSGTPEPSETAATAELIPVKEEEQELQDAQSLGAILSVIGVPEVVADEPVATGGEVEQPNPDQSFLEEQLHLENPAEAAFTEIDRAKEEDAHQDQPSSPSEQNDCEVEATNLLELDALKLQARSQH